jgi:hypothetical protein
MRAPSLIMHLWDQRAVVMMTIKPILRAGFNTGEGNIIFFG